MRPFAAVALVLVGCEPSTSRPTPVVPVDSARAVGLSVVEEPPFQIAIAHVRLCLLAEASVRCGTGDELARPWLTMPAVSDLPDPVFLAAADAYACAVTRAGTVRCWGDGAHGELGAGPDVRHSERAVEVLGLRGVREVWTQWRYACALTLDQSIWCWGDKRASGDSGDPPEDRARFAPRRVDGLPPAVAGALGEDGPCVLTKTATVWCQDDGEVTGHGPREMPWGRRDGLSGTSNEAVIAFRRAPGPARERFAAVRGSSAWPADESLSDVPPLRALTVSAGGACALLTDRRVMCWGLFPQDLQHHRSWWDTPIAVPFVVDEDLRADVVVMGGAMACAVTAPRDVRCWGRFVGGSEERGWRIEREPVAIRLR